MKEYEVHFQLNGYYWIDADSKEEAREKANELIDGNWRELENLLATGVRDDDYTTDILELPMKEIE